MKSTSGEHYIALDHVRALAVMLVFVWHFVHGSQGFPVPFEGVPFWGPLVLFDEGHVGVALFMTLSGYLFAKLLDGKRIIFHLFVWNRLLRLMPLLILVLLINALILAWRSSDSQTVLLYLLSLPAGLIYPVWPNGGWSITVELHFYLLLPLLLFIARRWSAGLLGLVAAFVGLRYAYHHATGEVQSLAYATIFGRIDQFLLGITAFHFRSRIVGKHAAALAVALAFVTLYWWFDANGGFYLRPVYPSPSRLWIILPTCEGLAFATLIAWYDGPFVHGASRASRLFATMGEYSYAIYLLHFFFVFSVARWIHVNVLNLGSFYVAFAVAVLVFFAMMPIGYLSMRFVERPFLSLRRQYAKK